MKYKDKQRIITMGKFVLSGVVQIFQFKQSSDLAFHYKEE